MTKKELQEKYYGKTMSLEEREDKKDQSKMKFLKKEKDLQTGVALCRKILEMDSKGQDREIIAQIAKYGLKVVNTLLESYSEAGFEHMLNLKEIKHEVSKEFKLRCDDAITKVEDSLREHAQEVMEITETIKTFSEMKTVKEKVK